MVKKSGFQTDFFRRFRRFVSSKGLAETDTRVLMAVSGGVDSMVMFDLFRRWGVRIAVAHCNFGLRGSESDMDEQLVRETAASSSVTCYIKHFDTAMHASLNRLSIQMAARELRYEWFAELATEEGFDAIATAHHADDLAETFLINLLRGAGPAGLRGIPARNGKIIRPMLFARRLEIETYAQEGGLLFREDRSNQETKYLRNKIRHEVIPMLQTINPSLVENLMATSGEISETEMLATGFHELWTEAHVTHDKGTDVIRIPDLLESGHPEMVLRRWLYPAGFTSSQVENLVLSLKSTKHKRFLSGSHILDRTRNRLILRPVILTDNEEPVLVPSFGEFCKVTSPVLMSLRKISWNTGMMPDPDPDVASLDLAKIVFPLELRKWRSGDRFHPYGMKGGKKVSDFFSDLKFTSVEKENAWLLCSGGKIAWIVGYRTDNRFRIKADTRAVLEIRLQGTE